MDKVTVSSIQGNGIDGYQVLVESGKVVKASKQEWIDGGEKLLVKLQVAPKASEAIDSLMASGMDHHLLVKEGDYTEMMTLLCKYMGVKKVTF